VIGGSGEFAECGNRCACPKGICRAVCGGAASGVRSGTGAAAEGGVEVVGAGEVGEVGTGGGDGTGRAEGGGGRGTTGTRGSGGGLSGEGWEGRGRGQGACSLLFFTRSGRAGAGNETPRRWGAGRGHPAPRSSPLRLCVMPLPFSAFRVPFSPQFRINRKNHLQRAGTLVQWYYPLAF
jgi:hypothetical protein